MKEKKDALNNIVKVINLNINHFKKHPSQLNFILKKYVQISLIESSNDDFDIESTLIHIDDDVFYEDVYQNINYWIDHYQSYYKYKKSHISSIDKNPIDFNQLNKYLTKPSTGLKELFSYKYSIHNYIFNTIGNGFKWYSNGLLISNNYPQYLKYNNLEKLDYSISKQINYNKKVINQELIKYNKKVKDYHNSYKFLLDNISKQKDKSKIIAELITIVEKTIPQDKQKSIIDYFNQYLESPFKNTTPYIYNLCDLSLLNTMPLNVHISYKKEAIKWCNNIKESKQLDDKSKMFIQDFLNKNI